jgi:zinc transport system substrate-binding protein
MTAHDSRQPPIAACAAQAGAAGAAPVGRYETATAGHDPARRKAIAGGLLLLSSLAPGGRLRAATGTKLKIGTTLHPYYSFVANIVGDKADVTPLIDAGFNPHNYTPRPQDMKRAGTLDALVVNGIGHDEFAFHIVEAAGVKQKLRLIYANDGVALIPLAGAGGDVKQVNPHTFVAISAAVQQVYTIARALGELDRPNTAFYLDNARTYTTRLRRLKAQYMAQLADLDVSQFSCATMHDAYGYLMQEFGLRVGAVIEPRHGVQPTARQLAETIDRIKAANVQVLFAEKYFASKLSDSIKAATGVEIHSFSHISDGEFTADKFEQDMQENLQTLVRAVRSAAAVKK